MYSICISSSKMKTLVSRIFGRANRICGKGVQYLQVKEYRLSSGAGKSVSVESNQ